MNKKVIEESLGIRSTSEEKINLPVVSEEKTTALELTGDETIDDISKAKNNVENVIEQGKDALKEVIALAKQSESVQAFAVASELIKSIASANRTFADLSMQKKKEKSENKDGDKPATNITNNNLILSTTDMLKMLKGDK